MMQCLFFFFFPAFDDPFLFYTRFERVAADGVVRLICFNFVVTVYPLSCFLLLWRCLFPFLLGMGFFPFSL